MNDSGAFLDRVTRQSFDESLHTTSFLAPMKPSRSASEHVNRAKGVYICGEPGMGKSSLIVRMALADIKANRGVCVIDPTGDLIPTIADWIPKERVERDEVIYFKSTQPVPIDFFSYNKDEDKEVLVDFLVDMFNLDNAPVSQPRLIRIINTLLEANRHPKIADPSHEDHTCTFVDILNFIEDLDRQKIILSYTSADRRRQWSTSPKGAKDYAPIVERMTRFTESPALNEMLSCKHPSLNIEEIMRQGKVLLIDLRDTPSDFYLGSLIIAKIQHATFARRYLRGEQSRTPFYLYIDECNTVLNYGAARFESIMNRARKYKLCITLANPLPDDLPAGIKSKLRILGTKVIFKLDEQDAGLFKGYINPFPLETLGSLERFQAITRVGGTPRIISTPKPLPPRAASYAEIIFKRTVDSAPLHSAAIPHDEVNGHHTQAPEPQPSAFAVPPHKPHKTNPRKSR